MKEKLEEVGKHEWALPKSVREGMRVDAKIFANKAILGAIEEEAVQQLTNVAMLPGVVGPVIGLPDMHWGYGLPMGAVGAFDSEDGIISAGLCGFDINCSVNLLRTNLTVGDLQAKQKEIIDSLYKKIPVGVGSASKLKLSSDQMDDVLVKGAKWAVENGYGDKEDIPSIEEGGCMEGADPSKISSLAKKRGRNQLGTLGAGNHFLEIQKVTDVFQTKWGVDAQGQIMIMIHCGSRGLGHQVASDYMKIQEEAVKKYDIKIPDRQLACAPVNSKEGQDFYSAMKGAVNYAFANKIVMTQWVREEFEKIFNRTWQEMDMHTVYGVCHNIVKLEEFDVNGEKRKLYVHRKGATRSYPNLPVIIAGSMGTSSYLLEGTETALKKTFGSSAHGAGRAMSRGAAIRMHRGDQVQKDLMHKGIYAKAPHPKSLAEEAPKAYKDVEGVVATVHEADISRKVARLEPFGVIKG